MTIQLIKAWERRFLFVDDWYLIGTDSALWCHQLCFFSFFLPINQPMQFLKRFWKVWMTFLWIKKRTYKKHCHKQNTYIWYLKCVASYPKPGSRVRSQSRKTSRARTLWQHTWSVSAEQYHQQKTVSRKRQCQLSVSGTVSRKKTDFWLTRLMATCE